MPLDLTGDVAEFKGLPKGTYPATVFEIKMAQSSGQGKTPAGTPALKVQFKIQDGKSNNRRAFLNLTFPPKDYEPEAAAFMRGNIVSFFQAVGYKKEEIQKKGFDPDFEDIAGKEVKIVLGDAQEYPPDSGQFNNPVNRVMPADAASRKGAFV